MPKQEHYICLCEDNYSYAGEGGTPEAAYQRCNEIIEGEYGRQLDASECRFFLAEQIPVEVNLQITRVLTRKK